MRATTFLFERNGFKVYKLTVLGSSYFVAERTEKDLLERYIRKSLSILEQVIAGK